MVDQNGYKINEIKYNQLKRRVDSYSKRLLNLCNKLLKGELVFDELTKAEREMVVKSDCFL